MPRGQRRGASGLRTTLQGIACALVVAAMTLVPARAFAHGGDETEEGYLLVQQALGHLAHETNDEGIALAAEKVDDALATKDNDGVNVAEVRRAATALAAHRPAAARALLQDSIQEALNGLPPATGNMTGTTVVMPAMPGRSGGLHGQDVVFLITSLTLGGLGAFLAYRFRPEDSVRVLRRRLSPPASEPPGGGSA